MRKRAKITGSSLAGFGDETQFSTTTLSSRRSYLKLQINVPYVPVWREEWPGSNRLVVTELAVRKGALLEVTDPLPMTVVGRGCCFDKRAVRFTEGREQFYLLLEELT